MFIVRESNSVEGVFYSVGQAPAHPVPARPQPKSAQGDDADATLGLNVESCFSTSIEPQLSHSGFVAALETNASNALPHFLHLYSKIGMSVPSK